MVGRCDEEAEDEDDDDDEDEDNEEARLGRVAVVR
jgi:hypothetical protein